LLIWVCGEAKYFCKGAGQDSVICPSGNRIEQFQQIAVLLIVVAGSFKERMQNGKRKVVVIVGAPDKPTTPARGSR
jgi:hypothetical protein